MVAGQDDRPALGEVIATFDPHAHEDADDRGEDTFEDPVQRPEAYAAREARVRRTTRRSRREPPLRRMERREPGLEHGDAREGSRVLVSLASGILDRPAGAELVHEAQEPSSHG